MTNPILNLDPLPLFDQILPEHIAPALAQLIHDACHTLAIVTAPDFPADWSQIAAIHHTALERLTFTRWGIVWHLSSVAETPALRTAFNAAEPEYAAFWARRNADKRLYAKYKAIDPATLNPEQAQAHRNVLREFVLGGVELTGAAKVRFKQIQEREAALGQKFEENVRDATNTWARYVSTHELAGVSEDALASTAAAAKAEGKDGHKITLWTPGLAPSRALREKLYRARVDACTELFDRPEFDNTGIVAEILALRQERAALLGYRNYAELSLVPKMAESPEQVVRFLRDLAARTRPYAEEKLAELRAFAAEHLGLQDPKPWDWYYIIEKFREARYAFTAQEVKRYFTAPKVLSGLFKRVEILFEVEIRKSTAPVWHPSVEFYRIERNGALLGQLYVDLSAREGKRDGAWAFPMRSRWLRPDTDSLQTPVVQLVCNFAQGLDGKPPLLTHPEVTLLFHEFGHALHHLLTQVDEIDLAGANGVEFDCTELPSQFMENFCWEWDVLKNMTAHVDTGEPLPRALFDKMLAARNLASFWSLQQRQIESALLDMRLHAEPGSSVQAMVDEVRAEIAVINPPAHTQTPNTFLHIFSYIFAAGFYSYNWSEVLSADAYAAFEETTGEDGTVNMETARRYRQAILETGGSRPASESFKAFRGREPTINAWLRHQGMG